MKIQDPRGPRGPQGPKQCPSEEPPSAFDSSVSRSKAPTYLFVKCDLYELCDLCLVPSVFRTSFQVPCVRKLYSSAILCLLISSLQCQIIYARAIVLNLITMISITMSAFAVFRPLALSYLQVIDRTQKKLCL